MKVAVMIMAAGESQRFKGCKLLSQIDDTQSLLSNAVANTLESNVGPVFVVTGRWHSEIEQAQKKGVLHPVPLLYNSYWSLGLGSSISYGVKHLAGAYDAILITLADQVALESQDFIKIVSCAHQGQLVCSRYSGRRGVPALFPSSCFNKLLQLKGEYGARDLLGGNACSVREISLPHAAHDIDTRQGLAEWQQRDDLTYPEY